MSTAVSAAGKPSAQRQDPFNWPSLGRADTMSLNTLD